jgi:hypothetical protein
MKLVSLLTTAFIPQIPTNLFMTELERMVAKRAIGASFVSNIYSEISLDRIALEFANWHFQASNIGLFSILLIVLYGQYKYNMGTQNAKFEKLSIYNKYERGIRELLFILFLVFTRDVNSAT